VSAAWDDLDAEDAKWWAHEVAQAPDRTAEIDAVVTEAIDGAARIEAWLIWALVWAVVILLPLAIVLALIHALGWVIGLIIAAAIAGLAGFIYLDQKEKNK